MITIDRPPPLWARWAAPAAFAWTLLYGLLQAWWAAGHRPEAMSPIGRDLIFPGWIPVALCLMAALLALVLGRGTAPRLLRACAWVLSVALVMAAALILLDLVGGLLPGMGVRFFPLGFLSRAACLAGGLLLGATALAGRRLALGACLACGRTRQIPRPARTPVWAMAAAYAALAGCLVRIGAQAVVGFDTGALGVGVSLVLFEAGFVLAGTLLPMALVYPWVLGFVATPQFGGCDGLRDPQGTQGAGREEAPGRAGGILSAHG